MSDAAESGDINGSFVEDESKVKIETTTVNYGCVKNEPNEGTLDFEEDSYAKQYRVTLEYENIFGESSHQIKIEEDYDNLIGFLDNDVIMENAMIKLEAAKEEVDGSFNNFHCSKCKGIYKGHCLKCSTLLCILNNSTSVNSKSNIIPTDILEIRTTSRGKGVYLLRTLPINVIFGPFEGILGIESIVGHSWKITDNKLENIKSGNWMKNIDCATSASMKNLDVFQIDGNLYFQTNREITEGEELLIYYEDEELQQLDNSEECLYTPQKQEKLPKIFACTMCCLGFGSNKCLMEHKRKCWVEHSRGTKDFVLIECHYCKMWIEKWEHEEHHVAYCLEKHHRMSSEYSEAVDRNYCGTRAGKRRYQREFGSSRMDRRDDLQFDTKDYYQCVSRGSREDRLNEIALLERSNNEQVQNTIETDNKSPLQNHLNKHRGIKALTCDICMIKFAKKDYLTRHIRNKHTHDGSSKDYKCSKCSFQTKYKASLQTHLIKHTGIIKSLQCDICLKEFTLKSNLKVHIKNKHAYKKHTGIIKSFQCDICLKEFTLKSNLKVHIKNKHADDGNSKDYQCSECSFQTNYKTSLQKHLNTHSGIKLFTCDICAMKFTERCSLKIHIKNKHSYDGSEKDYKCSECSFQTKYKANLQRHLIKHTGIKSFQCDICLKEFTLKSNLKVHIKNKHADDGSCSKDYKCSECSFQTKYKPSLQQHLNMHKGIKPFQCDICMMEFTHKGSLKLHIRNKHTDDGGMKDYKCSECSYATNHMSCFQKHLNKHKGIKPFQCDICMMEFTQKSSLKLHIRNKHTDDGGVKDHKCSECSYATNHKGHLKTHVNKHNSIKPFTCEICMMKFSRKDNIKMHMRNKHTNDANGKDYKCSHCSYETNDKGNFRKHLNKHKDIKPFQCDICMKVFGQKGDLAKHIRKKHAKG